MNTEPAASVLPAGTTLATTIAPTTGQRTARAAPFIPPRLYSNRDAQALSDSAPGPEANHEDRDARTLSWTARARLGDRADRGRPHHRARRVLRALPVVRMRYRAK